jgi:hypothetical protein
LHVVRVAVGSEIMGCDAETVIAVEDSGETLWGEIANTRPEVAIDVSVAGVVAESLYLEQSVRLRRAADVLFDPDYDTTTIAAMSLHGLDFHDNYGRVVGQETRAARRRVRAYLSAPSTWSVVLDLADEIARRGTVEGSELRRLLNRLGRM